MSGPVGVKIGDTYSQVPMSPSYWERNEMRKYVRMLAVRNFLTFRREADEHASITSITPI